MKRIVDDLTDPADHLALDEAMLLEADEGRQGEAIRLWEFRSPVVVAGRSTRVADEINREVCRTRQIPILRRCTGGASVVGGPGCLMYSVVLRFDQAESLKRIDVAHQHVMNRVLRAVQRQQHDASLQGICDLTWRDRKCSGNALRIARRHLLYHGTILYDFDLPLVTDCLLTAPRQPAYRRERDHASFVTNVPIDPTRIASDLCSEFEAQDQIGWDSMQDRMRQLRDQRYDAASWHFRH